MNLLKLQSEYKGTVDSFKKHLDEIQKLLQESVETNT
jgi:hypothetical protein